MPNPEEMMEEFRIRLREVIRLCEDGGIVVLPYCVMRTCEEQARLYRRSRTMEVIRRKIQSLRDKNYPFLADVLERVGPQKGELGKHVTKAAPGESWHNYSLAADCVPVVDGKAKWEDSCSEWVTFGRAARVAGLSWAGEWTSFREYPHIQLSSFPNPLSEIKSPAAVEDALKAAGALTAS